MNIRVNSSISYMNDAAVTESGKLSQHQARVKNGTNIRRGKINVSADAYVPEQLDLNASTYQSVNSCSEFDVATENSKNTLGAAGPAGKVATSPNTQDESIGFLIADVTDSNSVLTVLSNFANTISYLSSAVKEMEESLTKGINATEQTNITAMNNKLSATEKAEHESDSIGDFFMDLGKFIVNVVMFAVDIGGTVVSGGTLENFDAGSVAEFMQTIDSAVQMGCQAYIASRHGDLNGVSSTVLQISEGGLLSLIHNKVANDIVEGVMIVAGFAGGAFVAKGFGGVAMDATETAGNRAIAGVETFAVAGNTLVTAVGGIGSMVTSQNSALGQDFSMMEVGVIAAVLIGITKLIIEKDDPDMSSSEEDMITSAVGMVGEIVEMYGMYNAGKLILDKNSGVDIESASAAARPLARRIVQPSEDGGEEMSDMATNMATPEPYDFSNKQLDTDPTYSNETDYNASNLKITLNEERAFKGMFGVERQTKEIDMGEEELELVTFEKKTSEWESAPKGSKEGDDGISLRVRKKAEFSNIYRKRIGKIFGHDRYLSLSTQTIFRALATYQFGSGLEDVQKGVTELKYAAVQKKEQTISANQQYLLKQQNIAVDTEQQSIEAISADNSNLQKYVSQLNGLRVSLFKLAMQSEQNAFVIQ